MAKDVVKAFLSTPFGKTPEEKVYWESFESGIKEVARLFTDPFLEIHSAKEEVSALVLKENVKQLVDMCDITIAVITKPNPNIFWEVGYTEAQRKPVVFLLDEEATDLAQSPVLVIEALKCPFRSSMLAALARERKLPEEFARRLKPFLDQAIHTVTARPTEPTVKVFGNREACHLPSLVATANTHIYLITTNLIYFADFDRFIVEESKKVFAFDPPVEKGVDVKILTLDPDSPIVKYRAEQLRFEHNVGRYREELISSARKFYERYKDKANVNIRLYDDLPLQITLMVDDQVMTSVMSRGDRSRVNLHFLLSINTPGAKDSFEKHFYEVGAAPSKHISTFGWAAGSAG